MFLPMSWMSPCTVASTMAVPSSVGTASPWRERTTSKPAFTASAEAMSCGRKNSPRSKRSPTASSAGMNTPSMTSSASWPSSSRSVAATMGVARPVRMRRSMARTSSAASARAGGTGMPAAPPAPPSAAPVRAPSGAAAPASATPPEALDAVRAAYGSGAPA